MNHSAMKGTPIPPLPFKPETPAPLAESVGGPIAPVIRPEPEPPPEAVFAIQIAPGFYIRHFYSVLLKSGIKIEAQSDEFLPTALIEQAEGKYTGKRLLKVPGHYWFLTDLIPIDRIETIHIFQKRVPGRPGISAKEI